MTRPYYFGVAPQDRGHHLYDDQSFWPKRPEAIGLPFKLTELDSAYCPNVTRQQGVAKTTYENGWTVLSFWDQTGDSRPGSHSTFLLPGALKWEEAVAAARAAFPQVMKRAEGSFKLTPMCCSICRGPTGYEMEGLYEFVCDGCA